MNDMGVYIKGMKMPEDCRECPMQMYNIETGKTWCIPADEILADDYRSIQFYKRPEWCPLVEVSESHGNLIDEDELVFHLSKYQIQEAPIYGTSCKLGNSNKFEAIVKCIDIVESEHVVIEAEGE